jgi:EAL domain-containing protein (putative c-di-GMP-specific phosphodiesterase class I)
MGISQYPIDGEDDEELLKNADIAMYKAKRQGKNQFEFCSEAIKDQIKETLMITNSLHRALERKEMQLYYQPQVSLETNTIVGVEALLRWNHPEIGFISPAKFIPLAEKTRAILPIGEWVLRTACEQARKWLNDGYKSINMGVNFSVYQILEPNIESLVSSILDEFDLQASNLEIELTESVALVKNETVDMTMENLKKIGVRFAIDDFGKEYSSLSRLKDLPIDKVKLDMSFVNGIGVHSKDEAIMKGVILMAKSMSIETIAEGVETKEQLEFLKENECKEVQGYYLYKPMPADEISALLTKKE